MIVDIKKIIEIALQASESVMSIYDNQDLDISHKLDRSVVTAADKKSHKTICTALNKCYPSIPVISEESVEITPYDERRKWEYFFLVDPLDGTKEFISHNGEFTVNIALIRNSDPILGVIHAPAMGVTYYAEYGKGAYKILEGIHTRLRPQAHNNIQKRVVISRSHSCPDTIEFMNELKARGMDVITQPVGSALKFGLIAEGSADMYPRFAPTMEWDTAAGQILVNEVGKRITLLNSDKQLQYNKPTLLNPRFIVQ